MEDCMPKMNVFSCDNSNDFTHGSETGEPLIALICSFYTIEDLKQNSAENYKKFNKQNFVFLYTADVMLQE